MKVTAREISGRGLAVCDHIEFTMIYYHPVWSVALVRFITSPATPRQIVRMGDQAREILQEVAKFARE